MQKNGIDIVRIRADIESAKVDPSLAEFLRDKSLRLLEEIASIPLQKKRGLEWQLAAVEEERALVKREILERTKPHTSGPIVLAVSKGTRERILGPELLGRFEEINRRRDDLLEQIKRIDDELRPLEEDRELIRLAYCRQMARHVAETRRPRRKRLDSTHP
jgi:hypothetical protein